MECIYCSRSFETKASFGQHRRFCEKNPHRDLEALKKAIDARRSIPRPKIFDDPVWRKQQADNQRGKKHTEITKKKLSEASRTHYADPSERLKQSNRMRQVVADNPDSYTKNNVVGRVRNIEYRKGVILKGSWEVIVAQALDSISVEWIQPEVGFLYYWNNGDHTYYPDFYLPTYDVYIEVKGYERERDHCKWAAVENLIVLKAADIKAIKNGNLLGLKTLLTPRS